MLLKNKGFQDALSKLEDTWEVPAELNDKLEEFTTAMYGTGMYKNVNATPLDMLRAKCGGTDGIDLSQIVDLGQFPPYLNALEQHIRRANYQTCVWKAADKPRSRAPSSNWWSWLYSCSWKNSTFVVQWSIDAFMHSFGRLQAVMMTTLMIKNQIARLIWHLMNIQCQKVRVIMSEYIPYIGQCIMFVPE